MFIVPFQKPGLFFRNNINPRVFLNLYFFLNESKKSQQNQRNNVARTDAALMAICNVAIRSSDFWILTINSYIWNHWKISCLSSSLKCYGPFINARVLRALLVVKNCFRKPNPSNLQRKKLCSKTLTRIYITWIGEWYTQKVAHGSSLGESLRIKVLPHSIIPLRLEWRSFWGKFFCEVMFPMRR